MEREVEDFPPHTPAYEELMEVVTRAVARLNIDWPAEKQDVCPKSKLDLRFLPSQSQPVSYRVYSSQISNSSYLSPESASFPEGPNFTHQAGQNNIDFGG